MSYSRQDLNTYASSLSRVASLSNLYSTSNTPFIHYRATEYLFIRAFGAEDWTRSDIAIDVKLGRVGIGIKTFMYNGRPKYEKIAEFNKKRGEYANLSTDEEKVAKIAELRNDRINVAENLTGATEFIYHCIARLPGKLFVFEDEMPRIDINNIEITNSNDGSISFTDGHSNYRFNVSKSTLFREFYGDESLFEKPVTIYEDPFTLLESIELEENDTVFGERPEPEEAKEFVILPLYSQSHGQKFVAERSGLNQWNAGGRERGEDELYIRIPSKIWDKYPNFLPNRNTPFNLHFPNGEVMTVKVCQEGNKALMSDPNSALGHWLLRDVLKLPVGELATYKMLEDIGIDSVKISLEDGEYHINFKEVGTYERFIKQEPNLDGEISEDDVDSDSEN